MTELPGTVVVGVYGTRFAADTAGARLAEAGYQSAVLSDPAAGIAPHLVTAHGFRVVVAADAAESARRVFENDREAEELDSWFYERRFADRPTWIRAVTWILIAAIPVPLAVAALGLAAYAIAGAFPS